MNMERAIIRICHVEDGTSEQARTRKLPEAEMHRTLPILEGRPLHWLPLGAGAAAAAAARTEHNVP